MTSFAQARKVPADINRWVDRHLFIIFYVPAAAVLVAAIGFGANIHPAYYVAAVLFPTVVPLLLKLRARDRQLRTVSADRDQLLRAVGRTTSWADHTTSALRLARGQS